MRVGGLFKNVVSLSNQNHRIQRVYVYKIPNDVCVYLTRRRNVSSVIP